MERLRRSQGFIGYLRRNPSMFFGLLMLLILALFSGVGRLFVNVEHADPISAPIFRPPSAEYPFGTDKVGRQLLPAMIVGTPITMMVGLVAGGLGVGIATLLGFIFFGDFPDATTWLGIAIIIASGIYVFLRERRLAIAQDLLAEGGTR